MPRHRQDAAFVHAADCCAAFEQAWRQEERPSLERFLAEIPPDCQDEAFEQLLEIECGQRVQRGEQPVLRQYIRRFSNRQNQVVEVFRRLELLDAMVSARTEIREQSASDTSTAIRVAAAQEAVSASVTDRDVPVVDRQRLVSLIVELGLLSPQLLRHVEPSLDEMPSAMECVEHLVSEGYVTDYQAEHLLTGRIRNLVLNEYLLLERLGQGGMGMVFKAKHVPTEKTVALKILPAATSTPSLILRFQREVELLRNLRHANIIQAQQAGEAEGVHYLEMEYIPGHDLHEYVKKNGPLTLHAAIDCLLQAARGLLHAHEAGIFHRDIKPGNLLISQDGVVKILDLGLARMRDSDNESLTRAGDLLGTANYMAPEQALRVKDVDQRSDVYSLGYTFYFALTGTPPYQADNSLGLLYAHWREPIPSLQAADSSIPDWIEMVYRRMVAKQIDDRYPHLAEVIEDLECKRAPKFKIPLAGVAAAGTLLADPSQDHRQDRPLVEFGQLHWKRAWLASSLAVLVAVVGWLYWAYSPGLTREALHHEEQVKATVLDMGGLLQVQTPFGLSGPVRPGSKRVPPGPIYSITLNGNPHLRDEDLRAIGQLSRLEHLNLTSTNVTDEGLKHLYPLVHLRAIDLADTRVTDRGIRQLTRRMRHLTVHHD